MFYLCFVIQVGFAFPTGPFVLCNRQIIHLHSFLVPDDTSSCKRYPERAVIDQNLQMHSAMTRKSEETFYGFYPEGFETFDFNKIPKWKYYSLKKPDIGMDTQTSKCEDIWSEMLRLNERIIPPPFTSKDLARVSLSPILSDSECEEIISECENHYWGWGTSNERYGTPKERVGSMIKLEDLSRTYSLVNFELLPRLFPAIIDAFPSINSAPENLRLGTCRVVKYNADEGRVELGMHRDGLLITANIALNDQDEYEGGGTIIEGLPSFMNAPIRLKRGHVLLHPGDVKHGGAPITKGVRYVLVCFIFDKTIVPHEKYCQDRMQKSMEYAISIPLNDQTRKQEREIHFKNAAKHCSDAFALGRLSYGEECDGYEEMMRAFQKFIEQKKSKTGSLSN